MGYRKYKNIPIDHAVYGHFDSQKEYRRFLQLKALEDSGKIVNLMRQVPFELIPTAKNKFGKCIYKKCVYYADFVYTDPEAHELVVEDVKGRNGTKTPAYEIKKKLMYYRYGILIKEV